MKKLLTIIALLLCALASKITLAAPSASVQVNGAVVHAQTWTTDQLKATFASQITPLNYTLKGQAHTAHVISLLTVIDNAALALNPKIKNYRIQFVVEVIGQDGYAADFSLAELLPEIGHRAVWIALDEDGKPFASEDGPVSLLSPDDQKPSRWVHGVATIHVRDLASEPEK